MLFLCSDWGDPTNCSLIQAEFLNDSDERAGGYPCLHVLVNATAISPEKPLHLRYDEAAVDLSPEVLPLIMQVANKNRND